MSNDNTTPAGQDEDSRQHSEAAVEGEKQTNESAREHTEAPAEG